MENPRWTITNTANELRRSIGGISEDLLIASWWRTHQDDIQKFEYAYEALEFIRKRKRQIDLDDD